MEYFKGTYSFFRYPNERLIGFSPFLGYLNVKSGFLRKAFDMKRGSPIPGSSCPYVEQLVDDIFYSIQGNLTATIRPRKPIYIIAKSGLLNEFIVHVMLNNIKGFKKNHEDELIYTHVSEYTELLKCECNKIKKESECTGYCTWESFNELEEKRCQLKKKTSEINNNKRKFAKNLREFFELINKCIENTINPDENNIFTPYYLLGLVLMSYWYLIKNTIYQGTENEYFNEYMKTVKIYINNTEESDNETYLEIDELISRNDIFIRNLFRLPNSLSMIIARINNKVYPACFETVVNEFFNILFYDDSFNIFIPKIEEVNISQSLIEHYEYINKNNSDYTSHYIINEFVKLTTNIPGIEYNDNGYNIKSNYKNFLNILNYFLNTDHENLVELLEKIGIIINNFNENNGILNLNIKGKNLILNIKKKHSFSKREDDYANLTHIFKKDNLFNIFLNSIYLNESREIGVNITFNDRYNMLNYNTTVENEIYYNFSLPIHILQINHNIIYDIKDAIIFLI